MHRYDDERLQCQLLRAFLQLQELRRAPSVLLIQRLLHASVVLLRAPQKELEPFLHLTRSLPLLRRAHPDRITREFVSLAFHFLKISLVLEVLPTRQKPFLKNHELRLGHNRVVLLQIVLNQLPPETTGLGAKRKSPYI